MRARSPGPSPPPTAAAPRATAPRSTALRTTLLGLAGACALLAAGAPPAAAGGALVTVIDNSGADSWLEIDRTADLQQGSGSAGSDHDGAGSLVGGLLGPAPPAGPSPHPGGGGGR